MRSTERGEACYRGETGELSATPERLRQSLARGMLGKKLLDAGSCRGQSRTRLPLRNELAIREQLRKLLGDRVGVRFVIACQHEARCAHCRDERAVDAVDKAGRVEVPAKRVQHLRGGLRVVLEGFRPPIEPGGPARSHRADAPDRLCQHSTLDALGLGLDQVEDERPADALTVEVAAIDAQVVEQRYVVGGVAIPSVVRGDRGARLTNGVESNRRRAAASRR